MARISKEKKDVVMHYNVNELLLIGDVNVCPKGICYAHVNRNN